NPRNIRCRFIGKRRRRVSDAWTADRRWVEYESERLVPGADDAERRRGRFDIGDARARRDKAQIGVANGCRRRGADAAGGIDDRQRYAALVQRLQPLFDLASAVNGLYQ